MSSNPNLTQRDLELCAFAWQCLKEPGAFAIDYVKLAQLAGYKTPASANATFLVTKKKLLAGAKFDGAAPPKSTVQKKPASKGAKANKDEDNPADDDSPNETNEQDNEQNATQQAAKKKPGRKPKATAVPENAEGVETSPFTPINGSVGDVDTSPTPTKKRGRKQKDPNAPPAKRTKKAAALTAAEEPGKGKGEGDGEDLDEDGEGDLHAIQEHQEDGNDPVDDVHDHDDEEAI